MRTCPYAVCLPHRRPVICRMFGDEHWRYDRAVFRSHFLWVRTMIKLLLGGIFVSLLNFALHGIVTGIIIVATRHTATITEHLSLFFRVTALLTITTTTLMCAHLAEISVWAVFYSFAKIELQNVSSFEFAFENFTALGYGDTVAGEGYRLIGPITALNGLLLIGWSVAIIFEVLRIAEVQIATPHRRPRSRT